MTPTDGSFAPVAHLRDGAEEPLELHMLEVASRAEAFAEHFAAADWGRLLGVWHDLGKYRDGFQRHIRGEVVPRSASEHSIAGACLVAERFSKGDLGKLFLSMLQAEGGKHVLRT